jgi:hypothetical protein
MVCVYEVHILSHILKWNVPKGIPAVGEDYFVYYDWETAKHELKS